MIASLRRLGAGLIVMLCAAGAGAEALRVCADPNNLPYSNRSREGFENRIAELLAGALDRSLEYVWWPQRRGFLRQLKQERRCDLVMGVPVALDGVLTTEAYYRSGYVFLWPKAASFEVSSLNDPVLRDVRIGVHLIGDDYANSPPAHALGARGIVDNVVGFSVFGDYGTDSPPGRLVDAVGDGRVDLAIVWGPIAGFFRRKQAVPLEMKFVPEEEQDPATPFYFDIGLAVRPDDAAFRDTLNGILVSEHEAISKILDTYGVPVAGPVR